ncbi:tRNA(adenine(34)) deaminase, chloroplastic [Lactuca sativa]|uniref:tRNA(adenine(34)) deaminase, chloroplastic n=1 Tax=Lactuca sativa TaxID=4236 RepID=UPI000CAB2A0A|nr:tRNA(adenine(34)) deaminase, chloroplastic [Lactuca sativa]
MHTICFNPDVSLSSRPLLSLPSNHASYMFDEMFERNPLLFSSRKCCCCYSAANISMCNRLTVINPSFLCKGLSQSTLIQWSLSKRLIFHGSSRQFYGNTSGVSSFTDGNYYHEKLSSFNDRRKHRQRGFGHKRKKKFLGNVSDAYVNDVDVMLSLLTDEVGLEYSGEKECKQIDKNHFICDNMEKKNVDSGVVKRDQRCDKEQGKILEKKDTVKGHYGELVDRVANKSGSRMKCKQFEKLSDKDNSVIDSTFSSQKLKVISEMIKPQKINLSGTSSMSESRMKNCEEISTEVCHMVKDIKEEKHQKTNHLIKITTVSSENSQERSRISDTHVTNSENSSVSHRKKSEKHKLYPSLEMKMVEGITDGGHKGPSDEMWHMTDASSDHDITSSSEILDGVKKNIRSLLTVIGDVIRFRCSSPRSESHIPHSGGGKCSSCLSLTSEAWFSSHDSNNDSTPCNQESPIPFPPTNKTSHVSLSDSKFDEWEDAYSFEDKKRKEDEMFMREALLEAKKAADVWEVPVGAVLVHNGKIIARGYNLVEKLHDSTAHAEMICIREASKILGSWRLSDTTLYVTLEPCPMCAGAILQARIDTLVWGAPNKLLGADGSWIRLFSDGNEGKDATPIDKLSAPVHPFHKNMSVRRGVLAEECSGIMKNFFRLRRKKKSVPESPIPLEPESPIPSEPESLIPPTSITVSHHHSDFLSKIQHAFKIIFCL